MSEGSLQEAAVHQGDPAKSPAAGGRGRGPVSPAVAFLIGLVLLGAMLAAFALAGPGESSPPPVGGIEPIETEEESFALTDAEAIARFKELDAISIRAYKSRDPSLIPLYLTIDSPLRREGYRDLRKLIRNNVRFRPRLRTIELLVEHNDSEKIVIRQTYIERSLFTTDKGRPVSKAKHIRLTVDWTLHRDSEDWKLFDSEVVASERLD